VQGSLSAALADAHDINYADFSTSYARHPGSHLHRDGRIDRAIIDLPALPYNGVFRSRVARREIAAIAEETRALAAARRVPVAWRVTLTTPPATTAGLEAAGWALRERTPVMAVALDGVSRPAPPPGVRVEEVGAGALADWSRVVAVGFGCPEEYVDGPAGYDRDVGLPGQTPLRRFLAWHGDDPAAASALLPGPPGSRLGGIFCVATLEPWRGQGLGALLTGVAMHAARDGGATTAVLQASQMGQPVYRRLGFAIVGHIGEHQPG